MKKAPIMDLYERIMEAEDAGEIYDLKLEVETAIYNNLITDNKDVLILNMALQIKSNYYLLQELSKNSGGTTILVVGNPDDFDPEKMQLESFQEEEKQDFKDGNVVLLKDVTKKDK